MLIPVIFTACAAAGYGFTVARHGALALRTRIWALICLAGSASVGGTWSNESWAMRGASFAGVVAAGLIAYAISKHLLPSGEAR